MQKIVLTKEQAQQFALDIYDQLVKDIQEMEEHENQNQERRAA